jgi:2-methylcitrate dehydratase PrpD
MTVQHDASPTRRLAAFSSSLKYQDIPAHVRTKARELLLDYLGHTAVAVREDPARRLQTFARTMGGPPQARILGTDIRVAAPWAAFVNGAMGHMAELDDTHRGTMSHPGDTLWATALAIGEQAGASGEDVITAVVAGYEVCLRIGEAAMPDHYRRGWHTSGTLMAFGAAATAARLLGLDARATAWALGTAGAQASGNFAHLTERAMTKDFNCGHAAKSGTIAALLAQEGFTGPTDVLENPRGFLQLYGGEVFPEKLTAGLGQTWRTLDVAHKPYSACRHIHASIDALLELQREAGFAARDVVDINARIFKTGAAFVDDPVPWEGDKGLQGLRFSAQFNLAVVLLHGREGLWRLLDNAKSLAYRDNSDVRGAMTLISVTADEGLDANFPDQWSSLVEVRLKDGRTVDRRIDYPLGEPEAPMGADMLQEKFRRLTALAGWDGARAQRVVAAVQALASIEDMKALLAAL